MGDSLSLGFAMLVGILIMFFFPMLDSWERQDDLSYMAAYSATVDVVDAVRNTGVLTEGMMDQYLGLLASTGNSYDLVLEHREYKVVPSGDSHAVVYLNHYTDEIYDTFETSGEYGFNKGDYFYVSIKNTNQTQATVLKQSLYSTPIEAFKIGVPYGGQIKTTHTR